jgi:hypothetical protein
MHQINRARANVQTTLGTNCKYIKFEHTFLQLIAQVNVYPFLVYSYLPSKFNFQYFTNVRNI